MDHNDPTTGTALAFVLGAMDGYAAGQSFTVGRGWPDEDKNEAYDRGVNFGQERAAQEGR